MGHDNYIFTRFLKQMTLLVGSEKRVQLLDSINQQETLLRNNFSVVPFESGKRVAEFAIDQERWLFLGSGFIKSCSYSKEGHVFIDSFHSPDSLFAHPPRTIESNQRSLWIEAISSGLLIVSSSSFICRLKSIDPIWETLSRKLYEKNFAKVTERVTEQTTLSSEERFHRFKEENPDLYPHLQQQDMARYLGVSNATISRLIRGINNRKSCS